MYVCQVVCKAVDRWSMSSARLCAASFCYRQPPLQVLAARTCSILIHCTVLTGLISIAVAVLRVQQSPGNQRWFLLWEELGMRVSVRHVCGERRERVSDWGRERATWLLSVWLCPASMLIGHNVAPQSLLERSFFIYITDIVIIVYTYLDF